jgi:hypothetical protein
MATYMDLSTAASVDESSWDPQSMELRGWIEFENCGDFFVWIFRGGIGYEYQRLIAHYSHRSITHGFYLVEAMDSAGSITN